MDTFIKALPAVIDAAGGSDELIEAVCLGAWQHAVGNMLSTRALAEEVRDKTLVIAVEDNIWQKQLEQMRDHLLFRLNNVIGTPFVRALEFRVAPERFTEAQLSAVNKGPAPSSRPVPSELVSAAAQIKDASLRRAFLGAAASCLSRLDKQRIEF